MMLEVHCPGQGVGITLRNQVDFKEPARSSVIIIIIIIIIIIMEVLNFSVIQIYNLNH